MKERWIGVGLGVGAALTLGVVWTDSAQAFSLGSTVTVENFVINPNTSERVPYTGDEDIEQGPVDVLVSPGQELTQFGGIWDIDLGDSAISFSLNSIFGNVESGNDIYRFIVSDFGGVDHYSLVGATVNTFGNFSADKLPFAIIQAGNQLDIVFPLGFAPGNFTEMSGELGLDIALDIQSTPVPTPALLPGLVGLGLAALRQRRGI
jgi:MYXO-CTERM domain-containing protein